MVTMVTHTYIDVYYRSIYNCLHKSIHIYRLNIMFNFGLYSPPSSPVHLHIFLFSNKLDYHSTLPALTLSHRIFQL